MWGEKSAKCFGCFGRAHNAIFLFGNFLDFGMKHSSALVKKIQRKDKINFRYTFITSWPQTF